LSFDFGSVLRAVVSPDDNLLSAGGGAALALLDKAGKTQLLSEMGKVPTVKQRDVVVTSGFNLPVNYIFHAATLKLNPDGSSNITIEDVQATMSNALRTASALSVGVLFAPLLGSGMAAMPTERSLTALLTAYADFISVKPRVPLSLVVVIFQEADLSRKEAQEILVKALPGFTLTATAPASAMLS
jgi:O-acetyl-ADP-ribose deacetylase (regulator of RNase III)